ncbi:IS30 family transposase [bacterium AH-315-K05]|nr:IS30 family transposase [bacterium AH-315-L21]MBN4056439.1 IS30 family transposase [bacterium AH-315-K05]MBN4067868.1 IS30 family transposase [Alkaliphilus transvaalensis]
MATNKHLSLDERIKLEQCLKESKSFKSIGRELNRDPTTVSKEVKNHILFKRVGSYGKAFNNCLHRFTCTHSYICTSPYCRNAYCRFCKICTSVCEDFKEYRCSKLLKPPYVCNGCSKRNRCTLEKRIYSAAFAQDEYEFTRSESRNGISVCEDEIIRLNNIISPLILKGQSIHHICTNNKDSVMCSEKTVYNYTDSNLFSARNIDLPRKVKYRPRKTSKRHFKVDKSCRIRRTYEDFEDYIRLNPDTPVVEMDSLEGTKGGKVLLTIHFRNPQFMLAFIRDANTSRSVIDIFEALYSNLSREDFTTLFPILLTDNGSEFSNPSAIELDAHGNRRTRVFYCDPSKPYQKGAVENNHTLIRRVIPKGVSLNNFCQTDIQLMMNHINSYSRKKLNNRSPHQLFSFLYGNDILNKLGATLIPVNSITLKPSLIKE